jgi:creatinine amidohydrolase
MAARRELVRDDLRAALDRVPISIAEKIREGARTFNEAGGSEAYFGTPSEATVEEGEASYEALSEMIVTSVIEALDSEKNSSS